MTLDKIMGGLFGVAIGDALGGTTEFMTPSQIKKEHGWLTEIIGGGCWVLEPGETTDDTAMTMAVAKGILSDPVNPIDHIGNEFMEWKSINPKDIGGIINSVFLTYKDLRNWYMAAERVHNQNGGKSAGNGSLMRCLPVALAYRDLPRINEVTILQSKMTHYDDLATEACLVYNRIAYGVLQGADLKEQIKETIQGTRYAKLTHKAPESDPSGFVVDTMELVIHILLTSLSFEEVVQKAANAGYDSDTVGAISGGLTGLEIGYQAIPNGYKNKILLRVELTQLAGQLSKLR